MSVAGLAREQDAHVDFVVLFAMLDTMRAVRAKPRRMRAIWIGLEVWSMRKMARTV